MGVVEKEGGRGLKFIAFTLNIMAALPTLTRFSLLFFSCMMWRS